MLDDMLEIVLDAEYPRIRAKVNPNRKNRFKLIFKEDKKNLR